MKKECNYCKGERSWFREPILRFQVGDVDFQVILDYNSIDVESLEVDSPMSVGYTKVRFCPMCGRKLNE